VVGSRGLRSRGGLLCVARVLRRGGEPATQEVASLLAEQGFAPEIEGNEIHMHRCPFDAIAEAHPDVVCSVHRGLVAGALEELGSDLEVAGLDVLPRPGVCILRLARRASHDR
jgi:predicted ArsR family transcriptional regulator